MVFLLNISAQFQFFKVFIKQKLQNTQNKLAQATFYF